MIELNKIYQGDCLEVMKEIPDKSVGMVLTSPPYNISLSKGNAYALKYRGYNDCLPNDVYINWLLEVLSLVEKKLADNGVILWNMNYGTNNNETMWIFLSKIITETNLTIADNIIWKKKSAFPNNCSSNKITRITENIFVLCRKSEYRTFFMNKKVVSTRKTGQEMYQNIFGFIEANNTDKIKTNHNATFSTELCEKLINLYGRKTILDPFAGIGTTGVAATNLNRNFILIEKEPEYVKIAEERLRNHPQEGSGEIEI